MKNSIKTAMTVFTVIFLAVFTGLFTFATSASAAVTAEQIFVSPLSAAQINSFTPDGFMAVAQVGWPTPDVYELVMCTPSTPPSTENTIWTRGVQYDVVVENDGGGGYTISANGVTTETFRPTECYNSIAVFLYAEGLTGQKISVSSVYVDGVKVSDPFFADRSRKRVGFLVSAIDGGCMSDFERIETKVTFEEGSLVASDGDLGYYVAGTDIAVVPEPSSFFFLVSGAGILFISRKKKTS